ncbi:MAG TPA: FAD-dependent oxidoreductase [Rhizomicrobium sp.]|jgi:2-polyprenyl-6-methoxyphenol hydroxylase-like FAD-dependent oxidoreductase|nr:FAD-dependent oxidoreductase [Rhizomicrobium sp.]
MARTFTTYVLICGAGAAGLTLAIDLARRGISFRLIDKLKGPFGGSRGKGIQPRSQEVFEDLGVIDRLVAAGGVYPPQRSYKPDGTFEEEEVLQLGAASADEPYKIPLMVPQFLTEGVLRARLAELGARAEFGCELIAFQQDDGAVVARMRGAAGKETIRARYLVGCDGGRSFVRHALGIDFPGKTLGVRAVVADIMVDGVGRDAWHRWNEGSAAQISLCPLAGTDMFQLQGPVPPEGEIDLSAKGLTQLLGARTGRADLIVRSVSWASAFHMNARLAARYRVERVFLAGDAAHIHPPTGGQGLNTSVQDGYNLGWKLAAVLRGAPEALLDTYEAERRPVAAAMLGLATELLEAAKRGSMRRGREVHQLDIGYPDTALALEMPARSSGVLAGDRAPDAPMRGAGGLPARLFALTRGPHWTLLGYEAARDAIKSRAGLHIHVIGARGDVVDEGGHFHDAYGVAPGDWVLVRPDGYVGAIVSGENVAALEDYLARVGLAAPDEKPKIRRGWFAARA